MKSWFVLSLLATVSVSVYAQGPTRPTTKPVKPKPVAGLKNQSDSFNYALGLNIATNLKQQGITSINGAIMQKAMADYFQGKPLQLNDNEAGAVIQKQLSDARSKRSTEEKAKGDKYRADNGKKKGVVTLPSGVQYEVIRKGSDTSASPQKDDNVVAHYAGTLIDGTEFDNSYKRGQPLEIGVSSVIPGWTEVLQLMHRGDKWRVVIPSDKGYGDFGSPPNIAGGATLIFEMELIDIKPKEALKPVAPGNPMGDMPQPGGGR